MSKFKVGDRVRSVSDVCTDICIDGVYVATSNAVDGFFSFYDDGGSYRVRPSDLYELVEAPAVSFAEPPIDTYSASAEILSEALQITQGARNHTHGAKERSFTAIAGLWNAYLAARKEGSEAPLTARNVSDLMILLKVGRSVQGTPVRDHFTDAAGYAALSGELAEGEAA